MDADGDNVRQLSFGALSEFTPTVLPDGRIMYARWEYVDKGAVAAKCIWAMRPDGTDSSEIYGNDIAVSHHHDPGPRDSRRCRTSTSCSAVPIIRRTPWAPSSAST